MRSAPRLPTGQKSSWRWAPIRCTRSSSGPVARPRPRADRAADYSGAIGNLLHLKKGSPGSGDAGASTFDFLAIWKLIAVNVTVFRPAAYFPITTSKCARIDQGAVGRDPGRAKGDRAVRGGRSTHAGNGSRQVRAVLPLGRRS